MTKFTTWVSAASSLLILATAGPAIGQNPQSSLMAPSSQSQVLDLRDRESVTVFSETGYRGRSEHFDSNDRRLDDNTIGNDGVNSVRVSRGCVVTLYEHFDYQGQSVRLDRSVEDMGRTRLGLREVSSLKVECGLTGGGGFDDGDDDGWGDDPWSDGDDRDDGDDSDEDDRQDRRELGDRKGALLFSETEYRGRFQFFRTSENDLARLRIGDDSVSSVKVAAGCRLTLFAKPDFSGERAEVSENLPHLRGLAIGADTASSLMVECSKGSVGARRGVTLFADSKFRGKSEQFFDDERRLSESSLGANRVGSVQVAPGCRATLHSRADFRGPSVTLTKDTLTLVGSSIGPDNAASLRVECRGSAASNGDELPFGSGVALYDRSHFQGPGMRVRTDVARLSDTAVGSDTVSSIRIAPGCEALLFDDASFRGRSVRLSESVEDLDRTPVRSNALSSIRVRCRNR